MIIRIVMLTFLMSFLLIIAISKSSFQYAFCVGKGGFGKVWKVDRKKFK